MVLDKAPDGQTIPRYLVYDIIHFCVRRLVLLHCAVLLCLVCCSWGDWFERLIVHAPGPGGGPVHVRRAHQVHPSGDHRATHAGHAAGPRGPRGPAFRRALQTVLRALRRSQSASPPIHICMQNTMQNMHNTFISDFCLQLLDGSFAKQVTHEIDGLIFQPMSEVFRVQYLQSILVNFQQIRVFFKI